MARIPRNIYLLVNDNPIDHAVFSWALSDVDPSGVCFIASSEDTAMTLMRGGIVPDFIFLDYDIPCLNVRRFIRRVRVIKKYRNVPVVLHCKKMKPLADHCLRDMGAFAVHYKEYTYEGVKSMLQFYFTPELSRTFLN